MVIINEFPIDQFFLNDVDDLKLCLIIRQCNLEMNINLDNYMSEVEP